MLGWGNFVPSPFLERLVLEWRLILVARQDENTPKTMWLLLFIVIGIVLVAVGVLIMHKQESIKPESTFDLTQ